MSISHSIECNSPKHSITCIWATSRWEVVDVWDPRRSKDEEEEDDEDKEREVRPVDDWVLCTLPPSFAISARAEPMAVVLNMTGERFARNRKIRAIQASCGALFANGPGKSTRRRPRPLDLGSAGARVVPAFASSAGRTWASLPERRARPGAHRQASSSAEASSPSSASAWLGATVGVWKGWKAVPAAQGAFRIPSSSVASLQECLRANSTR